MTITLGQLLIDYVLYKFKDHFSGVFEIYGIV